jgi:DNA ligase-1
MRRFAEVCEAVAATTKRNEKIALLANYFRSLPVEDAALAAVFLTGRPFPRHEETVLGVGGTLLWRVAQEIAAVPDQRMEEIYLKHGDLGAAIEQVLAMRPPVKGFSLKGVEEEFRALSLTRGSAEKRARLRLLLERASPPEAKYLAKVITTDLRIGLKENLVEAAIAAAFDASLPAVQRANMLLGDIGETLGRAATGTLGNAPLRALHPVGFMLASAVDSPAEALEYLPAGAHVEDKYDGVRAQAHRHSGAVKIFSRTLDEISEQFPELIPPLAAMPVDFILDGEILGWKDERPIPFTAFQQRLGRKQVSLFTSDEIPVVLMAFDLLFYEGKVLLDEPLKKRRELLAGLLAACTDSRIRLAPAQTLQSVRELAEEFEQALARGNEGIVAKDPEAAYTPGRRGKAWLKFKRPLATLDVVVTAVEFGHGKRRGLLSDYTFAVREGERLVDIGKAYSGLTDREIIEYTEFFKRHTLADDGFRRQVEPIVVLEVAFNNIQRSARHSSGFALRFPRILRIRDDKPVGEIDTLERVRQLWTRQSPRQKPSTKPPDEG